MFIKDYAELLEPLNRLTKNEISFAWEEKHKATMKEIKKQLVPCMAIKPIDYNSEGAVIIVVYTSWMAVGFGIFQEDPKDPKESTCACLGCLTTKT